MGKKYLALAQVQVSARYFSVGHHHCNDFEGFLSSIADAVRCSFAGQHGVTRVDGGGDSVIGDCSRAFADTLYFVFLFVRMQADAASRWQYQFGANPEMISAKFLFFEIVLHGDCTFATAHLLTLFTFVITGFSEHVLQPSCCLINGRNTNSDWGRCPKSRKLII